MRGRDIAFAVAIGAALVFASRGTAASSIDLVPIDDATGQPDVGQIIDDSSGDNAGVNDNWLDQGNAVIDNSNATPEQRLAAFLYMIRASEHRYPTDVVNDACYSLFYSRIPFSDFSDHPVLTGEMKGVRLPDQMCRDSGYPPGCVSTAAGGYQIIKPTWIRARTAGTWGPRLPDFSKASQDEAARRILIMAGALDYVLNGDFDNAIAKASPQWASLPKSSANQNPRTWQYALARYDEGLTSFA